MCRKKNCTTRLYLAAWQRLHWFHAMKTFIILSITYFNSDIPLNQWTHPYIWLRYNQTKWELLVKLSHSLKVCITFKIFFVLNIVPNIQSQHTWRSLDTVSVVQEARVLKSSIFVTQKLALHQNWVEFCQQSIGDIRISIATLYAVARRNQSFLVYQQISGMGWTLTPYICGK